MTSEGDQNVWIRGEMHFTVLYRWLMYVTLSILSVLCFRCVLSVFAVAEDISAACILYLRVCPVSTACGACNGPEVPKSTSIILFLIRVFTLWSLLLSGKPF